jgi:hypothetical protein
MAPRPPTPSGEFTSYRKPLGKLGKLSWEYLLMKQQAIFLFSVAHKNRLDDFLYEIPPHVSI